MTRRFTVLIALFALAACYKSPSDLLGDHANVIQSFNSLVVLSNQVYQVVPHGKSATICALRTRADLTRPCASTDEMKLERTINGNYIVQVRQSGRYYFALWMRSDPNKLNGDMPCFLWLGDGVVGQTDMSAIAIRNQGVSGWSQFVSSLKNVASEPPINREQLLEIVKVYERAFVNITADKWQCIGDRAGIDNRLIAIEGDNRHLQPFAPPSN